MAIQSAIPVNFDAFFPRGAFVVGGVRVIDADPDARKGQGEVTVKIASISEPQLPPEMNGLPFRPAVFEGLTVTPYVKEGQGRPRVAYSLRAREMKPAPKPRGSE